MKAFDLAEIVEELGGVENLNNLVKNLQVALEENAELKKELELYKSLNKAIKLGEYVETQ